MSVRIANLLNGFATHPHSVQATMSSDTIIGGSCGDRDERQHEGGGNDSEAMEIEGMKMSRFGVGSYSMGAVASGIAGVGSSVMRSMKRRISSVNGVMLGGVETRDETNEEEDEEQYEEEDNDGTERTENGARCLVVTEDANLDFFASPFILFDTTSVVFDVDTVVASIHDKLDKAYKEDPLLALRNILFLGNVRNGGKKNHPAYMVSLAWLWEKHPRTFIETIASHLGDNACMRDLLTIFSVITFNKSFPLRRLWEGEQPDADVGSKRTFLKEAEAVLFKTLLKTEFKGSRARDVVTSRDFLPHDEYMLHLAQKKKDDDHMGTSTLVETRSIHSSPIASTEEDPLQDVDHDASDMLLTKIFGVQSALKEVPGMVYTTTFGGPRAPKRGKKMRQKNVWHSEEFKTRFHEEKKKLHFRNYGDASGIASSEEDYKVLVRVVVNYFSERLLQDDGMAAKWAPTPNGAHDKSTKGVKAFGLPEKWGGTGGIAQAIAFKMYGSLLSQEEGAVPRKSEEEKRIVMTQYMRKLSALRKWTPEHLEGNASGRQEVPDMKKVTSRWLTASAPRVMTSSVRSIAMEEFIKKVESGEKGYTATSVSSRPHTLFKQACARFRPSTALDDSYESSDEGRDGDGGDDHMMNGEDDAVPGISKEIELDKERDAWAKTRKIAVLQWEDMQKKVCVALAGADVEMLPVVDVSGSMSGTPMDVAIALGVLLSFANPKGSPYHGLILPFDHECVPVRLSTEVDGDKDRYDVPSSLYEQMTSINVGGSTNLEAVFTQAASLEKTRINNTSVGAKKKRCIITVMLPPILETPTPL